MKRTAIVTGGSSGIGRATVKMMAWAGIDVLFTYCSDVKARDSLLQETAEASGNVYAVQADMGERKAPQIIFDAAMEHLGHVNILFNNAGVFLDSTFLTATEENLDQTNQPIDYCIAKSGINVLTTALAKELGPYGITVNAILPGAIPTKINAWQFEDSKLRETFRSGSALGELGNPDYIAAAVMYFISEKACWTTGVLMSVDGGFTL